MSTHETEHDHVDTQEICVRCGGKGFITERYIEGTVYVPCDRDCPHRKALKEKPQ